MKRFLLIAAAVVLLGLCVFWVLRLRSGASLDAAGYEYVRPERREIRQFVVTNGTITPVLYTPISSEISGRLERVLVKAGDEVVAGQPLIELDRSSLQAQHDEARLGVEAARMRAELAARENRRLATLGNKELVTEKELQEAETAWRLAENETEAREARLRLIESSLAKSLIVAPYAGRVLAVPARQGMTVTGADAGREGNMLLELADLTRLRVEATINEIDVGELALGLPVGITFDSAPGVEGTGKVTFISPAAVVTGQGAGGGYGGALENRVREFPIQVEVENSHPRIRPGVTARVHILTGRAENALALPLPAVFGDHETGEWFVFVRPVDDAEGEPVRTRVEVGLRDDHFVEIRSGLDAAAEVSLRRPPGVRLGQDK